MSTTISKSIFEWEKPGNSPSATGFWEVNCFPDSTSHLPAIHIIGKG